VRDTRRLIALPIACGLAGAGAAADIGVHRSVALTGSPEAIWSLIGDFCAIEKWDPIVHPGEKGGSVVEWKSTLQAAPGTDATAARAAIEEIHDAGLASLEKQDRLR
jgi:hypothetical protein